MIGQIIYATTMVLTVAVLARALLSWFPNVDPRNPFVDFIIQVTNPILMPLRKVMPRTGMMDFTPMIAILVIQVVGRVLQQAFA